MSVQQRRKYDPNFKRNSVQSRIMSWNVGIIKKRFNPDPTILLQDQYHLYSYSGMNTWYRPDVDNGRQRHLCGSFNAHPENNHRFQKLLCRYNITAYFFGYLNGKSAVIIFEKYIRLKRNFKGHSFWA